MKFRKLRKFLCAGMVFCMAAALIAGCGSGTSEDSAQEDEDSDEDSDDDSDDDSDTVQMSLDDGTTIDLIELEEGDGTIYGEYLCAADDSVWAFGGDILAVAYTDDDGEMRSYICELTFYQTAEANDDGTYDLCINLTNILENTSSCWYAANLVDEDSNVIGVALIDPSDEDQMISLTLIDDDDDDDEDEDEDEDDE